MPHICIDEILFALSFIPFIGFYFNKIHLWFHNKFKHKSHN